MFMAAMCDGLEFARSDLKVPRFHHGSNQPSDKSQKDAKQSATNQSLASGQRWMRHFVLFADEVSTKDSNSVAERDFGLSRAG